MEKILENAASQSPGLVIMVIIVMVFVKYLKSRDELIRDINNEAADARREQQRVIQENTVAATQNTGALNNVASALRHFQERKQL